MEPDHYRSLESLSFYCHFCGLLPTFLGLLIIFVDVVHEEFNHILIGLFMFITGYAQVKVAEKIDIILAVEREKLENYTSDKPPLPFKSKK